MGQGQLQFIYDHDLVNKMLNGCFCRPRASITYRINRQKVVEQIVCILTTTSKVVSPAEGTNQTLPSGMAEEQTGKRYPLIY